MSKQFGMKEVLDYTMFDYVTKKPLLMVDYATNTEVSTKSDRLDLRGGQGNYKLMSFDHTKDATFKSTLPLVDLDMLAHITGKPLETGVVTVPDTLKLYASASNTIELPQVPVTGSLQVYLLAGKREFDVEQTVGTPASAENTYSISGKVITLNATTAPEDTAFLVTYEYQTSANAQQITLTADKFPGYVRITGKGLMVDQVTGETFPAVFDILKAKVKPNATLTMEATNASKLELEYDLFAEEVKDEKIYLKITKIAA